MRSKLLLQSVEMPILVMVQEVDDTCDMLPDLYRWAIVVLSLPRALLEAFAADLRAFLHTLVVLLNEMVPGAELNLTPSMITLIKLANHGRECYMRIAMPTEAHTLATLNLSGPGSASTSLRFDEQLPKFGTASVSLVGMTSASLS